MKYLVKGCKTFRQGDTRWGRLGYVKAPYYMSNAGCGATACADLIVSNPRYAKITPKDTRKFLIENGLVINGQGTRWKGMELCPEYYGFIATEFKTMDGLFNFLAKGQNRTAELLLTAGTRGGVTWTTGGHYVGVSGYMVKNGKHYLYTRDPNGNRKNDGWHCYESTLLGLVFKCWGLMMDIYAPNEPTKNIVNYAIKRAKEHHKYKKGGWSWETGIECHAFVAMCFKECGYLGVYNRIHQKGYFYKHFNEWNCLGEYRVAHAASGVKQSDLKPGDILMTSKATHHSAIYIGDGKVAEAVGSGTRIGKFSSKYKFAYRIPEVAKFKEKKTEEPKKTETKVDKPKKTEEKKSTKVDKKMKGFDISYWQGKIGADGFKKALKAGWKFAILRIGYNADLNKDSVFENNYKHAMSAGLKVGVYWYSTALTNAQAKKEAQMTLKILDGRKLTYPVFFDFEDKTQANLGKIKSKEICETFCKVIEKAGYQAGVYASYNYLTNKIGTIDKKYYVWLAQYPKATYKGRYEMHQYSSTAKVDGIGSKIDVDTSTIPGGNYPKKTEDKKEEPKKSEKKTTKKKRVYPELPKKGYFQMGDKGVNVKRLQTLLKKAGYKVGDLDGIYGDKTASAVRSLQKKYKDKFDLSVDGLYGKKSQQALKYAISQIK